VLPVSDHGAEKAGPGSEIRHVLVVGAGLAGSRVCAQLRSRGFTGRITLLGAEADGPYDRPPLSKAVLRGQRDETRLKFDADALSVDLRLNVSATALRLPERVAETTAGPVHFDALVIATGAEPIRLPGDGPQHCLRTISDALALRETLVPGARVVVVGASWIGAEVATAALERGSRVTCIEAAPGVLSEALGDVGARFTPWWADVDLRLETMVQAVVDGGVQLADGEFVRADVVVTGIGVRPNTEWLVGSGLPIDRGVIVDEHLLAAPGVVAIGDVARWRSRRYGRLLKIDHWDDAASASSVATSSVMASNAAQPDDVHDPLPYFWSDQFGHKLQFVGLRDATSRPVFRGDLAKGKSSGFWLDAEDRPVAALVVDSPRDLMAARQLVQAALPVPEEHLVDEKLPLAGLVVAR
jgi:3-phenylpropionate/trans-cinnamate dioxygenase ferredoxin reductase subunit